MLADLPIILYWWSLLFSLGLIFLPLTLFFFKNFFDQGYLLSKTLALFLVSYFVWLLGSLKILPFFRETIGLVIIGFVFLNYYLFKKQNENSKLKIVKKHLKIWFLEEVLFFICLTFWSFIRGFQPDIHGLEKFMDFGFVNSILRSFYFPPQDMWMSGKTINYYYFGHFVTALLTKLSGLDSTITYNLMIATLFALCFTTAFSIGGNLLFLATINKQKTGHWSLVIGHSLEIRNLKLVILGGLLSASLLTLGGNLHLLWYFLKHHSLSGYWYPDATRFIVQKFGAADNTIHEFPAYSFVVADLHGHLLDLPFVLLFLVLILTFFFSPRRSHGFQPDTIRGVLFSLLLAVMFMTNAWDLPIYLLVLGAVLLWLNYQKYSLSLKTLWKTAKLVIAHLSLVILFSLPFHLHFQSLAQGLKLVDFHSPLWMLLVLWGWPLFLTLTFLIISKLTSHQSPVTSHFIAILLLVSWLLIIIPEFIYVKDIYIHSYQRANTMFKLTYQSFVMFSLTAGFIIVRSLTKLKKGFFKFFYLFFLFSFFFFLFGYPLFAIRSYYGLKKYRGLDGLRYLGFLYPDDYQAILWLRRNIKGQPVILEAVGESYTDFARVSANTGLPTVLGWPVHEWLWHGGYDEPGKRREEIRKIYESSSFEETRGLLEKYDVDYIFLGALERKQYLNLKEEKFSRLGKVIHQNGATKIYQLNP